MNVMMNWNIDDIPVFVAIVDTMGISAAAEYLQLPKSTVSRALSRLEDALAVRLIERNSRRLRITSEGAAFYRQCLLIMEQVNEASALMAGLTSVPSGKLVVTLPMAFSREIVVQHLNKFIQRYPKVTLDIVITSHPVDIIRDQIDVAVMIGPLDDSELRAKQLLSSPLIWVTSPEYRDQHELGEGSEALCEHVKICEKRYGKNKLAVKYQEKREYINLSGVIHINDPIAVREAVEHGSGISLIPLIYCKKQLKSGALVQVYQDVELEASSPILAVFPSRRLISNKVRAFIDFLEQVVELA
ncbi:LysR family transcriptional regulator [Marinomonas pollencensis]|uniref:DNA-binding transcriptional LysR family regulator n=1 Tax=Marinomonas pollencensis TaxID=491954 RepID=A0A3E0DKH5_9GAMM|nr:LysR family transcriptional regulator [Marinomonas pollencensis]REG83220.1 DNA-binding transcriptional LysR family regulator [Marinomonas pollencensis]